MDVRDTIVVNEQGERMTQRDADLILSRRLHEYADRLNLAIVRGASAEHHVAQIRASADFIQRWAAK